MDSEKRKSMTIQVVLASARANDREGLDGLLTGTPWELIAAASLEEAVHALHQVTAPIVLCDRELDERPWQQTLRILTRARRRTCVIVLSNGGGPKLCSEVARLGGFDLLARPFERDQVYATLMCAYAQYRVGWPVLSRRQPVSMGSAS